MGKLGGEMKALAKKVGVDSIGQRNSYVKT